MRRLLCLVAAVLLLLAGCTGNAVKTVPPSPAQTPQTAGSPVLSSVLSVPYVALGDSFSSGQGVPPFDSKDTGTFSGPSRKPFFCHRSKDAYPRVFARDEGIPDEDVKLFACSGAKIADFWRGQRKSILSKRSTLPQLDRIDGATLISLTIGGNDLGFVRVLTVCLFFPHCQSFFPFKKRQIRKLRPRLTDLYEAIAKKSAPTNAQIGVLGYPQAFSGRFRCGFPTKILVGFGYTERRWFRGLTTLLDSTTQKAVKQADPTETRIHYVSTLDAFKGRELCSGSKDLYMNRLQRPIRHSYHPNEKGQKALAKALKANYPFLLGSPNLPTLCVQEGADEAFDRGDLIQAELDYEAIGKEDPPPSCATEGLLNVKSTELTLLQAVGQESAGLDSQAQQLVADLRKTYPGADYTLFLEKTYEGIADPVAAVRTITALSNLGFEAAAEYLLTITADRLHLPKGLSNPLTDVSTAGPFAAAVLLERTGLHDEALTEFKKVLASDPEAAAVALSAPGRPAELDTLLKEGQEENEPGGWAGFKRIALPWAKAAGEIALSVLLALVLWRMGRASLRSPTEIKDFDDSEIEGGTKAARDLTALVRASVDRLSADLPATGLNVVTALEASTPLPPSVATDIPQMKLFAAVADLLQKVLPQRGWTVSGQLLAKSTRGVGLALRLSTASGRIKAETALWEADYCRASAKELDPTTAYDRLAIPVAAWIVYQITDIIWLAWRSYIAHPIARWKLGKRRGLIPTTDWHSYAFFAVGSRLQPDDEETAAELYEKALHYDPTNKAALYNRAVLDIKDEAWDLADDRLSRLEDQFPQEPWEDPLWYRHQYMSAVLEMNRELARAKTDPPLRPEPFELAKTRLTIGLSRLEKQLDRLEGRFGEYFPRNSRSRALFESLAEFEGSFVYALAGVVARLAAYPPPVPPEGAE